MRVTHQEVGPRSFPRAQAIQDAISLNSRANCATSLHQTPLSQRSCRPADLQGQAEAHTPAAPPPHARPRPGQAFPRLPGANYITGNRSVSLISSEMSPADGSRQNTCGRGAGQAQLQQMSATAGGRPDGGPRIASPGRLPPHPVARGLQTVGTQAFRLLHFQAPASLLHKVLCFLNAP